MVSKASGKRSAEARKAAFYVQAGITDDESKPTALSSVAPA